MLPATRDDCRRTLRRLELEAYSSAVSALRAQGGLGPDARDLLSTLRRALNIGAARHQAETRRVSNDALLATIAEQISGPNTGLEWAREGRRAVPIMPRDAPHTVYAAIADEAAFAAHKENEATERRERVRRKEPLQSPLIEDADESKSRTKLKSEPNYPPIVMTDQSTKISSDEGPPRKRSRAEAPAAIHRVTHQRHPNLSQIYTSYSKPHSGKSSTPYSRNSYGPGGKANAKGGHGTPRANPSKHRSLQKRNADAKCGQVTIPHRQVRSGIKSPTDPHMAGSQALCAAGLLDSESLKSQTPVYQADCGRQPLRSSEGDIPGATVLSDSPTMRLLTRSPEVSPIGEEPSVRASADPSAAQKMPSGKPSHLIIKKRSDNIGDEPPPQKIHIPNKQVISKQNLSNIKVLQNRQVVVAPNNNTQKVLNSGGKLITTKIVQHVPQKSQNNPNVPQSNPQSMDKVLIVPKSPSSPNVQSSILQRNIGNASLKNIFLSKSSSGNIVKDMEGNLTVKTSETDFAQKNFTNNADVKLSTKTFLLDSKSGQKVVFLPAKHQKSIMAMPIVQVKPQQGKMPAMKLVTVGGQSINPLKSGNITVLSKSLNSSQIMGTPTKIISKDSLNQIKAGDAMVSKVFSHVQVVPHLVKTTTPKGNTIVVQKGNSLNANTFKDANDSIGKASVELIKSMKTNPNSASVIGQLDESKPTDVVLLELSGEQMQPSEQFHEFIQNEITDGVIIRDDDPKSDARMITEDTPIVFHSQIGDECNADSMESTTDSLLEGSRIEDNSKSGDSCNEMQQTDNIKRNNKLLTNRSSTLANFTDWETELADSNKQNDGSKGSELYLELEMSSESETDDFASNRQPGKDDKELSQDESQYDETEDTNEIFVQHSSIGRASRTLLSQLQDDGSSSNDSPFVLTKNLGKTPHGFLNKYKSNVHPLNVQCKNATHQSHADEASPEPNMSVSNKPSLTSDTAVCEYLDEGMFQFGNQDKTITADVGA